MKTAYSMAGTVKAAVSFARRELFKVPCKGHREVSRSGGEDGLYRITLECGRIVEVTVISRTPAQGGLA